MALVMLYCLNGDINWHCSTAEVNTMVEPDNKGYINKFNLTESVQNNEIKFSTIVLPKYFIK